jgi:hypothetical protein
MVAEIKKIIQKIINVERTSLGGQEQIYYLEQEEDCAPEPKNEEQD